MQTRRKFVFHSTFALASMAFPAQLLSTEPLFPTDEDKNHVYELMVDFHGFPDIDNRKENLGLFANQNDALTMLQHDLEKWQTPNQFYFQEYILYEFDQNPVKSKAACLSVTDFNCTENEINRYDLHDPQHQFKGLAPATRKYNEGDIVQIHDIDSGIGVGIVVRTPATPEFIESETNESHRCVYINQFNDHLYEVNVIFDGQRIKCSQYEEHQISKINGNIGEEIEHRLKVSHQFTDTCYFKWIDHDGSLVIEVNPLQFASIKDPHCVLYQYNDTNRLYDPEMDLTLMLKNFEIVKGNLKLLPDKDFQSAINMIIEQKDEMISKHDYLREIFG